MYTHQVSYSKRIQSGILAGRLYHTYLRFCDLQTAKAFVADCESGRVFNDCVLKDTFTVEDPMIVELE